MAGNRHLLAGLGLLCVLTILMPAILAGLGSGAPIALVAAAPATSGVPLVMANRNGICSSITYNDPTHGALLRTFQPSRFTTWLFVPATESLIIRDWVDGHESTNWVLTAVIDEVNQRVEIGLDAETTVEYTYVNDSPSAGFVTFELVSPVVSVSDPTDFMTRIDYEENVISTVNYGATMSATPHVMVFEVQ